MRGRVCAWGRRVSSHTQLRAEVTCLVVGNQLLGMLGDGARGLSGPQCGTQESVAVESVGRAKRQAERPPAGPDSMIEMSKKGSESVSRKKKLDRCEPCSPQILHCPRLLQQRLQQQHASGRAGLRVVASAHSEPAQQELGPAKFRHRDDSRTVGWSEQGVGAPNEPWGPRHRALGPAGAASRRGGLGRGDYYSA